MLSGELLGDLGAASSQHEGTIPFLELRRNTEEDLPIPFVVETAAVTMTWSAMPRSSTVVDSQMVTVCLIGGLCQKRHVWLSARANSEVSFWGMGVLSEAFSDVFSHRATCAVQ